MSNAASTFAGNHFDFPRNPHISYKRTIDSTLSTNGATISVVNFSSGQEILSEVSTPRPSAQNFIADAIARMQSSLAGGHRPSVEIEIKQLNEVQQEDILWIKASFSDPSDQSA